MPGAGTVVGALGDGLAGVALDVTADGALLKPKEAVSRDHGGIQCTRLRMMS